MSKRNRTLLHIFLCTAFIISLNSNVYAEEAISFDSFDKPYFSPSRGEKTSIVYTLKEPAKVVAELYTADNYLVRTLSSEVVQTAGMQSLIWDGRDGKGTIVPDEAYTLVLKAINKGVLTVADPRQHSGGEIAKNLQTTVDPNGTISFFLSSASRVQIRAGIIDGPMLRSLANWTPRVPGKNIVTWNGMDNDNLVNLLAHERHGVSVTAFNLPDQTLITTDNSATSYAKYVTENNWEFTPVPVNERKTERNDRGISPNYYYQRTADKDPSIDIHLPESVKDSAGVAILSLEKPVPIKVTMDSKDEEFLSKTKYEVTFFVDYKFMSEEELGFMPITWLWQPNNLTKGKHILTVNVSGFSGHVGVKSIEFLVK